MKKCIMYITLALVTVHSMQSMQHAAMTPNDYIEQLTSIIKAYKTGPADKPHRDIAHECITSLTGQALTLAAQHGASTLEQVKIKLTALQGHSKCTSLIQQQVRTFVARAASVIILVTKADTTNANISSTRASQGSSPRDSLASSCELLAPDKPQKDESDFVLISPNVEPSDAAASAAPVATAARGSMVNPFNWLR